MADAQRPDRTASEEDAAETTARILLETEAVLFQPDNPFTFTSGRLSPVYVDCRRLISFPRARRKLMDMGAALIERRVEAVLSQPRSVQIAALQDPQYKAGIIYLGDPPGDAGGEPGHGGAVFLVGAGAENFVHRAERQPATRQDAVDRGNLKRQHPMPQRAWPLDPADAIL